MSNPVVLITGALTGIGRATAIAFAKEGARVVVAGRREEAGQTGTRLRRGPRSMSAASTPSKASPSRWRSRSPSRESG
jgi:NAD(P)-dependent dehydrogenase (short-subunit alcohol dehydrogenase family)